jgi:hypothetical protein
MVKIILWSEKMRYHLTSLHESIWDIVEFGAQASQVGDEDYDSDEATQVRHSTPKPPPYSLLPYVEKSTTKCKG